MACLNPFQRSNWYADLWNYQPNRSVDPRTGPLSAEFPLLALRTCKADVVVGLTDEIAARVEAEDPKWRVNGK